MKTFGIDISRWQGDFNFTKAIEEGVKFVIIKGGGGDDGLYTDSKFNRNYSEAKAKGLPVGCYWFSKALTVAEAKKEAEYFYNNILKGKQFELPVYMDVEHKQQLAVGKTLLTDIIKTFCEYLEEKGYWVGIYSSLSMFNTYMNDNELTQYTHWIAQWATECTYPNKDCLGMWQFGGETNVLRTNKVAGVTCDQNYMLVDFPTLIKKAGLNGFSDGVVEEHQKPTENGEVKVGDIISFRGGKHHASANSANGTDAPASRARVTAISKGSKHPIHLRAVNAAGNYTYGVYGWVDLSAIGANSVAEPTTPTLNSLKVGDIVDFVGDTHYATAFSPNGNKVKSGKAKVTGLYPTGKHPVHLRAVNDNGAFAYGVYGWVNLADLRM